MPKLIREDTGPDFPPGTEIEYVLVPGPPGEPGPQGPPGLSGDGVTNVFIAPDPVTTEVPEYLWVQTFPNGDLSFWVEDGT